MSLIVDDKKYPLYLQQDMLYLGNAIKMPVHSMVNLPGKLNKKELLKRHITITRNQGEIKLFVDGFEALGSIKISGVSNVSFEKGNFAFEAIEYYNVAKNPQEIRALFRNKFKPNKSGSLLDIPKLWQKFISSSANFSF